MATPDTTVKAAIAQMSHTWTSWDTPQAADGHRHEFHLAARSSCVLVVQDEQLLGILTEREVLHLSAQQRSLENLVLRDVMIHPVVTLQEADFTDLWFAVNLLQQHRIRHIPILDEQARVVGLLTHESLLIARQQTKTQQQESDQCHARLTDATPVGIFRIDAEGNCIYSNQRCCEMLGLPPEATAGDGWQQALHPDDRAQVIAETIRSRQENRPFELEYRLLRPDSTVLWVLGQIVAEQDAEGRVTGYVGTITDISKQQAALWEHQQAEEALQKNEAHQRALISALPDLIMRINREGIYLEFVANPTVHVVANLTEMVGTHVSESLPADLAQRRMEFIHLALQTHKIQIYEQDLSIDDKTQIEEVRIVPYGEDAVLALVRDISDRKRSEMALRKTEKQFRDAQRIAHLGNWELDLLKNSLYWSDEVFQIFEIDSQQVEASYEVFLATIHPDDRDRVNDAYARSLRDRTPYSIVHRLQLPDGRIKYVQEQCETLYAEDGTPIRSQGTVQDITHQREVELERETAEEALRQVVQGTAAVTGKSFFAELARHIAEALGVRYASVSQAKPDGFEILAFWADGALQPTTRLAYSAAPCCFQALQAGQCCHPQRIQEIYPGNPLFEALHIESYLGVGLRNAAGEPIGNLCIFDDRPLAKSEWATTLLQIFAARAGAELERYQTAQALECLTLELEQRVQDRTVALQDREAQLRDFFDNANDLIQSVLLENGQFEYVNRAWRETLGYSAADIPALTIFDVLHPGCQEHCRQVMEQIQTGILCKMEQVELTFLTKTQQEIIVEGSINCRLENEVLNGVPHERPVATRAIFRDITARKAAEKLLQEREVHYRALMDEAGDAILVADLQGNLLQVNRKAEELFGYPREQLIQMHQSQLHPPEDFEQVTAAFLEVAQNNRTQMLDARILRQDGQSVPVDIAATIVNIGDTQIIQGIFRDITERKQSENALRESQQFLQTVLDTFPLSIFWKDRESVYLGCNQLFAKNSGLQSPLEAIGKTDFDFSYTEAEAIAYRADDQWVMNSGEAKLGIEETLTLPNGKQLWLETNKIPLRDLTGAVVAMMGTFQDISDRKHADQTIRQQAERETLLRQITQRIRQSLDIQITFDTACQEIRSVIQADRVGIFKFDPDSGFADGEFVAESFVEGIPSVTAISVHDHCFGDTYASLYAKGRSLVVDDIDQAGLSVCHTNILMPFQVRAFVIMPLLCGDALWGLLCLHQCATIRHWQESEVDFIQQIANQLAIAIQQASLFEQLQQELTERQQAQQQLTERNQQLARATRLKDEFLANMSHELRTPLNAILGMTEGLQENVFGDINSRQMKALQTVERSGTHLLELINDILDVAKIEAGQLELDCMSTNVVALCQSSLAFVKQQALQKRIQLQVRLAPHIPNVLVDERRLRQVLINLLNNAVKFTPEGGQITLEAHCQNRPAKPEATDSPPQNFLHIAVIDTGIGIAPEHINKLFQPFIQIDSALNRQYQGTGLGLVLVKRIVELHGGHVGLSSTVGAGSCFTIDLPYKVAPPDAEPELAIVNHSSLELKLPEQQGSPLILLAEDNDANINTIASYLRAKGFRILLAKNGQEAIALAQFHLPDLILMDIQMPGMDGLEAMQQIRRDPTLVNVPIIALTALAMEGDRDRCLAAGASNYLSKPIKLKQLTTLIQQLLISETNT